MQSKMPLTHIPVDLLQRSDKILLIAHLAIGDFTYLQNCLRALSAAYPRLAIHVFVDELRRTGDRAQWPLLQKYVLYDWLSESPFIAKVYDSTYSPRHFRQAVASARQESYPLVVSLGLLKRPFYARLARRIAPDGFVAAQIKPVRFLDIRTYLAYRRLDAVIPSYPRTRSEHISGIYAHWFEQLFSLHIPPDQRFPFVDIPPRWRIAARDQFGRWGLNGPGKVIFLNGFAKSEERSWPLYRVMELARQIRSQPAWKNFRFIVNVLPEHLASAQQAIDAQQLQGIFLFSAGQNFFQLPAILERCHLIISVETSIMHLANALDIPVIALMRQTSPEWKPINTANSVVLTVATAKGRVDAISSAAVISVLHRWPPSLQPHHDSLAIPPSSLQPL